MISGKKVLLRRVEERDYPDVQRWQNDTEVFHWMDYVEPFSIDDIRRGEQRAIEEGHPFIIEAESRGIGRIGLNNFRHRDGLASLYVLIGERDMWGKGYGLDAIMVLLKYGFDVLGLRMIELWGLAGNERALHMYKTAGFQEDARARDRSFKDGRYLDHVIMSITADEFARTRESYGI